MKQKAAIYSRVSTTEQAKGYSLGSQTKGCQEYADRHGFEVIRVVEEDVSGATRLEERKGGRELLELAQVGEIDAIVVWRLDRLSRPPETELSRLQTTIEHFARKGVDIHDCESGAVKNGDMAAMMIAFFKGIVASQERAATRERTTRGRINKAKRGRWVGNGQAPYGYTKVDGGRDKQLAIEPDSAAIVRRMFDMYLGRNGETRVSSLRTLAKRLTDEGIPSSNGGKWYAATIQRMISSRTYLGEFSYSGITIQLPELAIIDEEVWESAQVQLRKNRVRAKRNRKRDYLLANHIRCTCGGRMAGTTVNPNGKEYRYYACNRQNAYGHIAECHEGQVRADIADELVWRKLGEIINDEASIRGGLREMRKQAARESEPIHERLALIESMIDRSGQKMERLLTAFADEDNDIIAEALRSQIHSLAALKENQEKERDTLRRQAARTEITQEFEDDIVLLAGKIRAEFENATYEVRRSLLDLLDVEVQLSRSGDERCLALTMAITAETYPIVYDAY